MFKALQLKAKSNFTAFLNLLPNLTLNISRGIHPI